MESAFSSRRVRPFLLSTKRRENNLSLPRRSRSYHLSRPKRQSLSPPVKSPRIFLQHRFPGVRCSRFCWPYSHRVPLSPHVRALGLDWHFISVHFHYWDGRSITENGLLLPLNQPPIGQ